MTLGHAYELALDDLIAKVRAYAISFSMSGRIRHEGKLQEVESDLQMLLEKLESANAAEAELALLRPAHEAALASAQEARSRAELERDARYPFSDAHRKAVTLEQFRRSHAMPWETP